MNRNSHGSIRCFIEVCLLLLTNGIANFLFIRKYTYYSDDWSDIIISPDSARSYLSVLSDCQRPIQFALKKLVFSFHGIDAFGLQVAALILSSIFLVLLYFIIKRLAADFGYVSYLPFVSSLLYIVLWNKDEAYPWLIVSICNEVGFVFYALSIIFYLYRERKYFLPISLIWYFLGLLTYETGFAIPVILLVYDIFRGKKVRNSLYFLIPFGLMMLIRFTHWFGFGYIRYGHDVSSFDPNILLLHVCLFIGTSLLILSNQVQFSVLGWMQVSPVQGVFIFIVDLLLIMVISWYLRLYSFVERGSLRYVIILLTGLAATSVPIIITTGGTFTRGYILIDFFVAALISYLCVRFCGRKYGKIIIMALFFCSLIICQGLYVNWVASGEITDKVAGYVCTHTNEISQYPYLYFNSSSYIKNSPNSLSSAFFPTREDLFRFKKEILGDRFDPVIAQIGTEDIITRIDSGYVQYYNAKCLDQWALNAMLKKCGLSNITLVYGGNWEGNFPTYSDSNEIRYQRYENYRPMGKEVSVPRSQVFEITYLRVYNTTSKTPLTLF